jgi:exonuclease SbcC
LDDVSKKRESLREMIKGKVSDQETLAKEKAQVDRDLVLGRQNAQNHNVLKDRLGAELAPLLASLSEPPEALRDPALSGRLEALVSRVTSARDARARARDTLLELGPKMAGQTSKSEGYAITVEQTRERANTRQSVLDELRVRRASLLGGKPTSAHRTRFNESRKAAHSLRDETQKTFADAKNEAIAAATRYTSAETEITSAKEAANVARVKLLLALEGMQVSEEALEEVFGADLTEVHMLRDSLRRVDDALIAAHAAATERRLDLEGHRKILPQTSEEDLRAKINKLNEDANARQQRLGAIENKIVNDNEAKHRLAALEVDIGIARTELDVWSAVNAAVGSRSGDRFARYAQSITLDVLTDSANRHLAELNPRYRLRRAAELALQVEDVEMGGEARATRSLSGGERFLVSLALALALSRMGGKGGLAGTLFIDEGFGSLDATSLDLAIDALEGLQSQGRQVGVISHVDAMKDRIPVQIMVAKLGGGKSSVRITGNFVQA